MNRRARTPLLVLTSGLALIASCTAPGPTPSEPPPEAASPAETTEALVAPTLEEIRGAVVTGILEDPLTLVDGRYEAPPLTEGSAARPSVELVDRFRIVGDLDDRPGEETAVLLGQTSGGSGSFVHLAVFARRGDEIQNLATTLIADRPQILSVTRDGRHVVVRLLQAGPEDAACCPTELATRAWALEGGVLSETQTHIEGVLSPALIAEDEWRLTHFDIGHSVPAEPEITLALGEDGTISGFGGCNRYFGPLREGTVGQIEIGPVASTKRACVGPAMALEIEYLRRLGAVERYGFWLGSLALSWHDGEHHGVLLLERLEPASEATTTD